MMLVCEKSMCDNTIRYAAKSVSLQYLIKSLYRMYSEVENG